MVAMVMGGFDCTAEKIVCKFVGVNLVVFLYAGLAGD